MILSAMGRIKRGQFSYIKGLLRLSDEALELADRHDIEEKKLRYVINVASEYHAEVVRQIIDFNLTSKQVKELCESEAPDGTQDDALEKISPVALKLAKVTQAISGPPHRNLHEQAQVAQVHQQQSMTTRPSGSVERVYPYGLLRLIYCAHCENIAHKDVGNQIIWLKLMLTLSHQN